MPMDPTIRANGIIREEKVRGSTSIKTDRYTRASSSTTQSTATGCSFKPTGDITKVNGIMASNTDVVP